MTTHQARIKQYVKTIPTRLATKDEIEKRYFRATKTESVSGAICKYTGALIAVIGAPLALLLNLSPVGISAAFGVFSGGASIAALGSNGSRKHFLQMFSYGLADIRVVHFARLAAAFSPASNPWR